MATRRSTWQYEGEGMRICKYGLMGRSPASCKISQNYLKRQSARLSKAISIFPTERNKTTTSSWKESTASYNTGRRKVFLMDGLPYRESIILGAWSRYLENARLMAPYIYTTAMCEEPPQLAMRKNYHELHALDYSPNAAHLKPNKASARHCLHHIEIKLQRNGQEEGVLPTPMPQATVCSSNAGCLMQLQRPRLQHTQVKLQHDARLEVGVLKSTNTTGRREYSSNAVHLKQSRPRIQQRRLELQEIKLRYERLEEKFLTAPTSQTADCSSNGGYL